MTYIIIIIIIRIWNNYRNKIITKTVCFDNIADSGVPIYSKNDFIRGSYIKSRSSTYLTVVTIKNYG